MSVTFKNKRGSMGVESLSVYDDEPQPPREETPAAKASREAERLAARAEVKQKIAQAIAAEERWKNLKEAVRDAEREKNEIGGDNYAQRLRAEEEIERIDEQHVEGAASGVKQSSETKARRSELVSLVGRLKDELERLQAPYEKIIERLKQQCLDAKQQVGYCHHQFDLIHLGRKDLVLTMRLAHGEWSASLNRLESIKGKRAACDPSDSSTCEAWDAQITAAEERTAGLKAALDAALQAVYDE